MNRLLVVAAATGLLFCGGSAPTMGRPVDYIPPTVNLTSPASGTATGNVTITANAHDDQGVGSVKFFVDGQAYGPLDQSAPFTTRWSSNFGGAYIFGATAYDKAGNATSAMPVSVTYIP
ncbi:MAG TPA: Ig-like domain-containing protein [Gemmatimonadales bacterium]|nr:Ig-like domain-containing protein [Gemmatimonadales bacterium]